jgi:hypothetical protein
VTLPGIDSFATQLLEEAKAFLAKAKATSDATAKEAYLHAALTLGFCGLEAHINAIAEDFLTLTDLSPHERSILSEQRVELDNGEYRLTEHLQIYRLEDRLLFLCTRFSKKPAFDRKANYWSQFKDAQLLRNALMHPKTAAVVTDTSVERALSAILQVLDMMYRRIYNKKYPAAQRGLHSTIDL